MKTGDTVKKGNSVGVIMEISHDNLSALVWWLNCYRYNFEPSLISELEKIK